MLSDIFFIILTGALGLILAAKISFPLWWKRDNKKPLVKQLITLVILGLMVIVPNTLIYYFSQDFLSTISWLNFSNMKIHHTAVSVLERNNGVGTALVDASVNALKNEGINKAALVVFSRNVMGNSFWEKRVFTVRKDLAYRNKTINESTRFDT